jgi:hypothetical protein
MTFLKNFSCLFFGHSIRHPLDPCLAVEIYEDKFVGVPGDGQKLHETLPGMVGYAVMPPLEHIVSLLIQERDRLNRAIEALQGPAKRRGRPPKNPISASVASPAPVRRRRKRTAAQRKAQAARMKAYWAKKRKATK